MKLYLKGERCYTEKCAVTRRPYPPGQHGQARIKLTRVRPASAREAEDAPHLRRARAQFRGYFCEADRAARAAPARRCSASSSAASTTSCYRMGFASTARRGAPARPPQARARERQARQHPELPASKPATRSTIREASREDRVHRGRARRAPRSARSSVARGRQGELHRHRQGAARPRGAQRAGDPRAATSSSTTRANDVLRLGSLRAASRSLDAADRVLDATRADRGSRRRAGSLAIGTVARTLTGARGEHA